jgi:alpha-beta hydrolase superfamily lysophospholipase
MRRLGKILGRLLIWGIVVLAGVYVFGPAEPVDRAISFEDSMLPQDLDAYLAAEEAKFTDIRPETEKRIFWNGAAGEKTPLSVVYLHGFSATRQEISPVPEDVAKALGANLFMTRLAGHGRTGEALAEPVAGDWIEDTAEALAIGRRLGERVLVIATSTGGTLAAIAATDPELSQGIAGEVLISPNFGIDATATFVLGLPWVREWGPKLVGETRSFEPENEKTALYWTTSYPTVAAVAMAALVRNAVKQDYGKVKIPALFLFSPKDQVVDPDATERVVAAWGGAKEVQYPVLTPQDDSGFHVITGDIRSPNQTAKFVSWIVDWAKGL